jgi:putative FmdB family regulatory protein
LANGFSQRGLAKNRLAKAGGRNLTGALFRMPTYDYVCTRCGHELEAFQSMKDAPLRQCPSCKKPALKRQVGGGAGLIFKGSGFYITDYKKKSGAPDAKPAAKATETKAAAAPAAT